MVVLTFLASATNYVSTLIFSRVLSPESFGDLTALLALTVVVAVPTGAAQTVIAERLAVAEHEGDYTRSAYLIRHAVAHIGLYAFVLGLLYVPAIPLVQSALDLQAIGPALALAPMLVLSFFTPLAFGILQGLERFVALGLVLLFIAFSRIAFGVPWALAEGGAGGALLGQALGNALALLAVGWFARERLLRAGTGAATAGIFRRPDQRALAASGAFMGFALLSNLDIVLAKLLLDGREAGQYAVLATIGKIIVFLPGSIALVMVPNAARARHTTGSAASVLRTAGLLVLLTALVFAVPAGLEPRLVIETMFGSRYVAATDGVLPCVIAGSGLALLNVLVVYTVAIQDRRWIALLLGAVVVQVASIGLLAHDAVSVAIVQAVVIWGALVLNELFFHPMLRAERLAFRRSSEVAQDAPPG
jgi:O-antigen/teichoic acid export membrane protein